MSNRSINSAGFASSDPTAARLVRLCRSLGATLHLTHQDIQELQQHFEAITLKTANLNLVDETKNCPWFIRGIQNAILYQNTEAKVYFPNLIDNNETIFIYSDYGGESTNSAFNTYSFLFCGGNQLGPFIRTMDKLRQKHGILYPFKEIAFKDLKYGPIQRMLKSYLNTLNNAINGLLVTLVVDKNVLTLFGENEKSVKKYVKQVLDDHGLGSWKPDVAEKLLRITHTAAYFTSILGKSDKKIFWMTDHDAIAEDDNKIINTATLLQRLLNYYSSCEYNTVAIARPFSERCSRYLDPLSACDLAAGSFDHYYSNKFNHPSAPIIKNGVFDIMCFLASIGISMKKLHFLIKDDPSGIQIHPIDINTTSPQNNTTQIPILFTGYQV